MRIHSDTLTAHDLRAAATRAGVSLEFTAHGSRSRAQAHSVTLYGSGRTGGRWGNTGNRGASSERSATWDEWGIFLEALFTADARVTVPRVYADREAFRWSTGARYDTLTADAQHPQHRWNLEGVAAGGSYWVHRCDGRNGCGAIRRYARSAEHLAEILAS